MKIKPESPVSSDAIREMELWEDAVLKRYPEPDVPAVKEKEAFRNYDAPTRDTVREFYRLNHTHQTLDFVLAKKKEYLSLARTRMGIWEAMEFLNELVDDSDPDIDLPQIEHLLQTAEAIRADGHPQWFVLAGAIHDLGKILCLWGEPQWAVVGDTFPVGCAYSGTIVYPDFFNDNPDKAVPEYQTQLGIYEKGCGLDAVHMSWGHDEYIYHVTKAYLPEPAQYMLRYHSFYPGHREGAYDYLMNDHDREMFRWVRAFNPYDLYTKRDLRMDVAALRPYYEDLIAEYFPSQIAW